MEDRTEDVDDGLEGTDSSGARPSSDEGGVVRVAWTDFERPSIDIPEAVAAATDRDLIGLPPLNDTLDGDAVEALLRAGGDVDLRLSFTYAGTSVVVDCGESIVVRPDVA